MTDLLEKFYDAAELLRSAQQIVALTGAGISTESGIPDFRSPGSIWLSQPPVSYHDFINKPEARQQYWQTRHGLSSQVVGARPNAAHRALVELERRHVLLGIITQNFDGLHQDAGHPPERVIELHGTSRAAACTLCGSGIAGSCCLPRFRSWRCSGSIRRISASACAPRSSRTATRIRTGSASSAVERDGR